jgi:hypothetical protein
LSGQENWVERSKQRFLDAEWLFSFDNSFTFSPIDIRDDLYPLHGTFSVNGNRLVFTAYAQSKFSTTGQASAEVRGQIDLSSNPPMLSFKWLNSAGNTAHIDDAFYDGRTTSVYDIRATLTTIP